jgi:ATP-dependent protease Clp ATPase subunit
MIAAMKARNFRCSFCGKSGSEVGNLMAGTPHRMPGVPQQMIGKSAFICDECVRRCSQLVTSAKVSRSPHVVSHKDLTF